jgi:hypothetical protein
MKLSFRVVALASLSHRPAVGDPPVWGVLLITLISTGLGIAGLVRFFPWSRRRQIVNIDNDQLIIRYEDVAYDAPKAYPLGEIRNLRYALPVLSAH